MRHAHPLPRVLLACSAALAPAAVWAATHTVTIEGMKFNPERLTVHRGDRIVWVNKDLFPHTVTADGRRFDSHSIAANASWSTVIAKAGDYAYTCSFHPTMKGIVSVK